MDDLGLHKSSVRNPLLWCMLSGLLLWNAAGCTAFRPMKGIKVRHLPEQLRGESRTYRETIDLRQLTVPPPAEHRVDKGDVLAIYVEGVLGRREEVPPVYLPQAAGDGFPTLGYPIPVRDDGTISLPLIQPISVRGMTLRQVEDRLKYAYTVEREHLAPGQQRVLVSLQRARQYQVLVIRQEQQNPSEISFNGQGSINLGAVKRGMGEIVMLPAYQNDVLHALAKTGGLPGLDAQNAVYVLRSGRNRLPLMDQAARQQMQVAPRAPRQVSFLPTATTAPAQATGLIELVSGSVPAPDPFSPRRLPENELHNGGYPATTQGVDPRLMPDQLQLTHGHPRQRLSRQAELNPINQPPNFVGSALPPASLEPALPQDVQALPSPPPLTQGVPGAPAPGFSPPRPAAIPGQPGVQVPGAQLADPIQAIPGQPVPGQHPDYVPPELEPYLTDGACVLRIPIRLAEGEIPMISPEDVTLEDGDIIFIESRETEVFYTGGLLGGGQFVLPRDYDLDVLAAISIASSPQNSSSGAGIGSRVGGISAMNQDISVSASDVIILRQLAGGGQVPIKVDLNRALRDPSERIIIQPGDYLILRYKPIEALGAIIERNLLAGSLIGLATTMQTGGGR